MFPLLVLRRRFNNAINTQTNHQCNIIASENFQKFNVFRPFYSSKTNLLRIIEPGNLGIVLFDTR